MVAQRAAAARQPRHDGAHRHALDLRRLGIAHPLHADEQQHLALLPRHLRQRAREIAQLESRFLVGQRRGVSLADRRDPRRRAAAQIVDVDIVQDGEEPGAQITAGTPQMRARERTREAILHEILGIAGVVEQAAGVAVQRGHVTGQGRLERGRSALIALARGQRPCSPPSLAPSHIAGCLRCRRLLTPR